MSGQKTTHDRTSPSSEGSFVYHDTSASSNITSSPFAPSSRPSSSAITSSIITTSIPSSSSLHSSLSVNPQRRMFAAIDTSIPYGFNRFQDQAILLDTSYLPFNMDNDDYLTSSISVTEALLEQQQQQQQQHQDQSHQQSHRQPNSNSIGDQVWMTPTTSSVSTSAAQGPPSSIIASPSEYSLRPSFASIVASSESSPISPPGYVSTPTARVSSYPVQFYRPDSRQSQASTATSSHTTNQNSLLHSNTSPINTHHQQPIHPTQPPPTSQQQQFQDSRWFSQQQFAQSNEPYFIVTTGDTAPMVATATSGSAPAGLIQNYPTIAGSSSVSAPPGPPPGHIRRQSDPVLMESISMSQSNLFPSATASNSPDHSHHHVHLQQNQPQFHDLHDHNSHIKHQHESDHSGDDSDISSEASSPGVPEFSGSSDLGPSFAHSSARQRGSGSSVDASRSRDSGSRDSGDSSDRKFQCNICGKTFRRDLPRHLRTHQEVARFVCPYPRSHCPHKRGQFNRPYDFKKHLLHGHFVFDEQKMVRSFRGLRSKLSYPGTCVCGMRFTADKWLDYHVLGGENRCPLLVRNVNDNLHDSV